MFNERDPRWPQPSKAEDLIEPNFGLPQKRKGADITQVIEEIQTESREHAAIKIQRNFRQHLKGNKSNKLIALKPLEEILEKAGVLCEFSTTAIESFISSNYLRPSCNKEIIEKNWDAYMKARQIPLLKQEKWHKIKYRESHNKKVNSEWQEKLASKFDNKDKIKATDSLYDKFMTGAINCSRMAWALRALVINNLQQNDLLTVIGGSDAVRVWKYEPIDHAFVVIKNFYGKEDIPKNHLVMDSWLQHCYLPKIEYYRSESKYPTSHTYYKEFISGVADKSLSDIVNKFEQQAKNDKHERRRGYIGPLENYQEFLVNHADGVFIVIDPDAQYEALRKSLDIPSTSISKDYFNKVPAPAPQDITYYNGGEDFYDMLYFAVTELINQR